MYYYDSSGKIVKHCTVPILYSISYEVPFEYHSLIIDSFEHWNDFSGYNLFYYGGVSNYLPENPLTNGVVIIGIDNFDGNSLAITNLKYGKGCINVVKVNIDEKFLNRNDLEILQTVVRHEAGHVLGLNHSNVFTDLMWKYVGNDRQHPVDVSDREIEILKKIYGWK